MDDDAIRSILELVALNQEFLIRLAAQVCLLETIASSANPKAYVELRKQLLPNQTAVRDSFAEQQRLLDKIRQSLLKKPN